MTRFVILQAGVFYTYVALAVACGVAVGAVANDILKKEKGNDSGNA